MLSNVRYEELSEPVEGERGLQFSILDAQN